MKAGISSQVYIVFMWLGLIFSGIAISFTSNFIYIKAALFALSRINMFFYFIYFRPYS